MEPPTYLSIVVTSRNDDHGGRLLRRMQIFVNGVIEQCRRQGLDAELIIVEWNPPPERPRLVEALRWPAEFGPCRVRIIEVPPERHRRFRHSETLPLFQMIAKNVGIRRARGRFVLATNVDLILSDELMAFLAARRLEKDRLYRIDRHDVMAEVPAEGTLDEQLAYCRTHLLRIHTRKGSFSLEPDGRRPRPAGDAPPRWHLAWPVAQAGLRRIKDLVVAGGGPVTPAPLHTNGCGDFTLLSRARWSALRGYAELEMFSFHLDSLFCYAAQAAGAAEIVLREPMRIYHIEHATGSGWTPEGQGALFGRLAAQGIPCLDPALLAEWAVRMRRARAPMIFNGEDWGIGGEQLRETGLGDSVSEDEAASGAGPRNRAETRATGETRRPGAVPGVRP
jgi:hypothetical protein